MAETEEKEEINYASVVFKTKNHPPPEGKFSFSFNTVQQEKGILKHAADMDQNIYFSKVCATRVKIWLIIYMLAA